MPILRGFKGDIRSMPPDIYVNEMPVPQTDSFEMPDFVLGFVGEFDRGPINEYIFVEETPTKRLTEIIRGVFGAAVDTGKPGNMLLKHINEARAKSAVFVRTLGSGYAVAGLELKDGSGGEEKAVLRVKARYPGEYANIFTAQVTGSSGGSFNLKLYSDLDGFETYSGLTMDAAAENYAVKVVNSKSINFVLEDISGEEGLTPSDTEAEQLSGGSDGQRPAPADYIGRFDAGTGERTGLKLLELAGKQITDAAYIGHSSQEADAALYAFAEKYNCMAYCGVKELKVGDGDAVKSYAGIFDTDFMQMVSGNYFANTGAEISGACLSAIIHAVGSVENSGLATECMWIKSADEDYDFDQLTKLYESRIGCFTLKPSETAQGALAYRMGNDYTLAKKDAVGEVLTDNENRKVNRRRLNNWIENSLFFVAAKWQGRAFTNKMKRDAEIRVRAFFDELKEPAVNPLASPKIENYEVSFDESAQGIDEFVQNITVKHFNTAEWILLNFNGGTNAEVSE